MISLQRGVSGRELVRIMCMVCGVGASILIIDGLVEGVRGQLMPLQCVARAAGANQVQQQQPVAQFSTQNQQLINLAQRQQQATSVNSNFNSSNSSRPQQSVTQLFVLPTQLTEPARLQDEQAQGEPMEETESELPDEHEEIGTNELSTDEMSHVEEATQIEPELDNDAVLMPEQDFVTQSTLQESSSSPSGLLKRRQVNRFMGLHQQQVKTRRRSLWDQLRLRSPRTKRQAANVFTIEPLVDDLARMLSRGIQPASVALQRIARQMLASAGQVGEQAFNDLLRQQADDLPVRMANIAQFAANLINAIAFNNPVILNSPTFTRARQTSSTSTQAPPVNDEDITQNRTVSASSSSGSSSAAIEALEALIRLLRSMNMRSNRLRMGGRSDGLVMAATTNVSSNKSLNPLLNEEIDFVNRLNDLTTGRLTTKASNQTLTLQPQVSLSSTQREKSMRKKRRKKRSIGTMLMLAPFSKLYTAMLVNKMLKYQSGVLSQAVVSELVRRYLVPGTSSLVSSALSPASGYLNLMKQAYLTGMQGVSSSVVNQAQQVNQVAVPARGQPGLFDADCQLQLQQPSGIPIQPALPQIVPPRPFEPSLSVDQSAISLSLSPHTSLSVPNLFPGASLSRRPDFGLDPMTEGRQWLHGPGNMTRPGYGYPRHPAYRPRPRPTIGHVNMAPQMSSSAQVGQASSEAAQTALELLLRQATPDQLVEILGQLSTQQAAKQTKASHNSSSSVSKNREQRLSELLAELAEQQIRNTSSRSNQENQAARIESADAIAERILNRTLEMSLGNLLADRGLNQHLPDDEVGKTNLIQLDSKQKLVKDTSDLLAGNFAQLIRGLDFEEKKRQIGVKDTSLQLSKVSPNLAISPANSSTSSPESPIQIVVNANSAMSLLERLVTLGNPTTRAVSLPQDFFSASPHSNILSPTNKINHLRGNHFELDHTSTSAFEPLTSDSDFGSSVQHPVSLSPPYQARLRESSPLPNISQSTLFEDGRDFSRSSSDKLSLLWLEPSKTTVATQQHERKIYPQSIRESSGESEQQYAEIMPAPSNLQEVATTFKRKPSAPDQGEWKNSHFLQVQLNGSNSTDEEPRSQQHQNASGNLGISSSAATVNDPQARSSPLVVSSQLQQQQQQQQQQVNKSSIEAANLNNLAMALNVMNMVLLSQKLAASNTSSGLTSPAANQRLPIEAHHWRHHYQPVNPPRGRFRDARYFPRPIRRLKQPKRKQPGQLPPVHPTSAHRYPQQHPYTPSTGTTTASPVPTSNSSVASSIPTATTTTAAPTSTTSVRPNLEREGEIFRMELSGKLTGGSNHRTSSNGIHLNESVQLSSLGARKQVTTSPDGPIKLEERYKFQPLNAGALSEPEHAARWNDILLHLNVSPPSTSEAPQTELLHPLSATSNNSK